MQVRALQLFVELARSDSIRQAAQQLKLTPTALSRQIDHLEYHFRAELIDRSAGGIRLTEAGHLLVEQARSIVNDVAATRALIDDLRGLRRGEVRVRAGGAVVAGLLAPVLCDLHALHPDLRFAIEVGSAGDVFASVSEGLADVGVTIFSPPSSKVQVWRSRQIEHAVIVSPAHPIAGMAHVAMKTLASHPLAIPAMSFGLRQDLERLARAASVRLDPVFVTGSLDMQKELAIRGAAALVLPPLCCRRELETGLLMAIPLGQDSLVATSLDVCTGLGRTLPFAAKALLDVIDRYLESNLRPLASGAGD